MPFLCIAIRRSSCANRCGVCVCGFAADLALTQKLKEEIKYEKEAAAEAGVPEFVKEFQAHGVWTVRPILFPMCPCINHC